MTRCVLPPTGAVGRLARIAITSLSSGWMNSQLEMPMPPPGRRNAASEPARVSYRDVVITKSKPGVRDYSGGHE